MNQECSNTTANTPGGHATPITGPVKCAPWCADGAGHATEFFAEDQWCRSAEASTTASLYAEWTMTDGTTTAAKDLVYVARDPGAASHVVVVTQDDKPMNLTPAEAREQAALLLHFAWVAEQDQSDLVQLVSA